MDLLMLLAFWGIALGIDFEAAKKGKSLQENTHMRIGFAADVNLQSLESLESLERLESLESLERWESLKSPGNSGKSENSEGEKARRLKQKT